MRNCFSLVTLYIFVCNLIACNKPEQAFRVVCKHTDGNIVKVSEITAHKEREFVASKENITLIAQLKENGQIVKNVRVGEGSFPIIPLFVKELDTLPQRVTCSVVDSYTVYVDGQIIKRIDGTCEWHGFERLKYACFFDSDK